MKLLFLDRDGVINQESATYIKHPSEWIPLPRSLDAIALATRAGFHNVVVTNQSGIGRKLFDLDTLHAIHQQMIDAAKAVGGVINAIAYCPHKPSDGCTCRKPQPGLLVDVLERYRMDCANATLIGDRDSDLQAAAGAGADRILVRTGHGRETESSVTSKGDDVRVFDDLYAAVEHLVTSEKS